jgi:3-oxoacyl-(acyl-carrier-protein) synthase
VQALSPAGRCKTFDASGDGYGRGEGCAVAVLKQAGDDSSPALAVLMATATNQDGRSSSLTAPNGPSQSTLITAAMDSAGEAYVYKSNIKWTSSCVSQQCQRNHGEGFVSHYVFASVCLA